MEKLKNTPHKKGILYTLALAAVLTVSGFIATDLYSNNGFDAHTISPLRQTVKGSPADSMQNTFREVYKQYKDSVVFISTEKDVKVRQNPFFGHPMFKDFFGQQGMAAPGQTQKRTGLGSGFIISKDGYICTNHHVIADMDRVTVKVSGKEYQAEVIGSDSLSDIALLKIKGKGEFKPVYRGNSDELQVGDWSIAIGNPFGLDKSFTVGVVSAAGREVDSGDIGTFIQTDASINPGNSGGPLINLYGEVIGVNRMIYSRSGGSLGIGFAIPINRAWQVLNQLKKDGKVKRGYIGVQIAPLTEEFAGELGLKTTEGALVGSVVESGPADKGGIKERDVILKVNGKKVKDYRDLVRQVTTFDIGQTVKLAIWRKKTQINLWITVKERPS